MAEFIDILKPVAAAFIVGLPFAIFIWWTPEDKIDRPDYKQ